MINNFSSTGNLVLLYNYAEYLVSNCGSMQNCWWKIYIGPNQPGLSLLSIAIDIKSVIKYKNLASLFLDCLKPKDVMLIANCPLSSEVGYLIDLS